MDFVGKLPDGTLVLTDWKTGRDDSDYETELQMAAYVLWAVEYYKMSPDAISSELVFLKTGEKKAVAFYPEQLRETEGMIQREFVGMNASYEHGDFPPRPSLRECLSCRFAGVCIVAEINAN